MSTNVERSERKRERKRETRGRIRKVQRERERLRARANSWGLTEGCGISGGYNVDPLKAFNDNPYWLCEIGPFCNLSDTNHDLYQSSLSGIGCEPTCSKFTWLCIVTQRIRIYHAI